MVCFTVVDVEVLAGNSNGNLYVPYLYFALTNAIPVAFGAYLVAYIEVYYIIVKLKIDIETESI